MAQLPTQKSLRAPQILRARVTDVDSRRHTVDVETVFDNRPYPSVQIGSPFYHYMGEGVGGLPDIGAEGLLTIPGDDTPPTLTCYLDLPTMTTPGELEAEAGTADVTTFGEESQMSFAGAKPPALPGDFWINGRDGNFTYWRRGGVLQEGASLFCQRVYNPLRNTTTDLCENYILATVGADFTVQSERPEDSADTDVGLRVRWLINELLEDTKASVLLEAGRLGDDGLLRVVVAPSGIDRATGAYSAELVELLLDKLGALQFTVQALEAQIASLECTIQGNASLTILGTHEMRALDSSETLVGTKRIVAPSIQLVGNISLGSGGTPMAGNADALYDWCFGHRHDPVTGAPVPPPPPISIGGVTG